MTVPCKLVEDAKQQSVQTYVVKFAEGASHIAADNWAKARGLDGAGAYAIVHLPVTQEMYLAITLAQAHRDAPRAANIKASIQRLPTRPQVVWVRPMTRRLQRLFGWGDVCATEKDIARACAAGNREGLRGLFPQAAAAAPRFFGMAPNTHAVRAGSQIVADEPDCSIALLPKVLSAMHHGLPELTDCDHQFWQESKIVNRMLQIDTVYGPCAREPGRMHVPEGVPCPLTHRGPYTKCTTCGLVLCSRCAANEDQQASDRRELAMAVRRARGQEPPPFWQHPERPLPFYVIDHKKWPDDEKLLWIKQEVGEGVDIPTFARAVLDLFGDKLRDVTRQKTKVLQLYADYAPESPAARGGWQKEADLPPEDLEQFLKVWKPGAPQRCWECGKAIHKKVPFGDHYCTDACRDAGKTYACRRCKRTSNVTNIEGFYRCTACHPGPNLHAKRSASASSNGDNRTDFDKRLDAQRESIKMFSRVWDMDVSDNPDHEPAWKRRRHS